MLHGLFRGLERAGRRFLDDNAGELIGADIVVIHEVLQDPPQLFRARFHLPLTQHDHRNDLVSPYALFDGALVSQLVSDVMLSTVKDFGI